MHQSFLYDFSVTFPFEIDSIIDSEKLIKILFCDGSQNIHIVPLLVVLGASDGTMANNGFYHPQL